MAPYGRYGPSDRASVVLCPKGCGASNERMLGPSYLSSRCLSLHVPGILCRPLPIPRSGTDGRARVTHPRGVRPTDPDRHVTQSHVLGGVGGGRRKRHPISWTPEGADRRLTRLRGSARPLAARAPDRGPATHAVIRRCRPPSTGRTSPERPKLSTNGSRPRIPPAPGWAGGSQNRDCL